MISIAACLLGRTVLPLCAALLACSPREQAAATPPPAASEPVPAASTDSSRATADSFPWLVVDTAARTATLELVVSRKTGAPSALINGYRAGEARIIIPVGWTVKWNWRST